MLDHILSGKVIKVLALDHILSYLFPNLRFFKKTLFFVVLTTNSGFGGWKGNSKTVGQK